MLRWLALIGSCGCYNPRDYSSCEAGVCTEVDAAAVDSIDAAANCVGRTTPPFHQVCIDPPRPATSISAVKTFNTNTECDMTIAQLMGITGGVGAGNGATCAGGCGGGGGGGGAGFIIVPAAHASQLPLTKCQPPPTAI